MSKEIERKFLVREFPQYLQVDSEEVIYQHYLSTGEEEIRVRKITEKDDKTKCLLTIKRGKGLVREEFEQVIELETYRQITHRLTTRPLIKRRRIFKLSLNGVAVVLALDLYINVPNKMDLMTVEVEFNSVEDAVAFQPLQWFGEEVTEDPSYKNQAIWEGIQDNEVWGTVFV